MPANGLDGVRFSFPPGGRLVGAGQAGLRPDSRSAARHLELKRANALVPDVRIVADPASRQIVLLPTAAPTSPGDYQGPRHFRTAL